MTTMIGKLLEKYRTIAEIPAEVAAASGFAKIRLRGGSYRLLKMDSEPELSIPYPLHVETPEEKALVAHVRSASSVPSPAVPAFGKDLSAYSWDGPLFRYHPVFAENLDFWRGKRILDLCCMHDQFACSLTELLGDEFTYTGVELDSIRYESAERTKGKPHITFHERTKIEDFCITLPPKSIDILCTFNINIPNGMYSTLLRPLLSEQGYLFLDTRYPHAQRKYAITGFELREQIWIQRPVSGNDPINLDNSVGILIYSKK